MLTPLNSLVLLGAIPRIWYAAPIVLAVSLVYGATRHERLSEILIHSFRSFVWIIGFMVIIFLLIWLTGFFV